MKKLITLALFLGSLGIGIGANAQKIVSYTYETDQTKAEVFENIIDLLPTSSFSVKEYDGDIGLIEAGRGASLGGEFATASFRIKEQEAVLVISATFRRNPGFIGGPNVKKIAKEVSDVMMDSIDNLSIKNIN